MNKARDSFKFHYLLHSADLIHDHLRTQLSPFNLSPQQARVIKALNRMGPVSQIELAREFGITAASMSTMTTRLIALNYVSAEKDPVNAKRNLISLTDDGRALIADIDQTWAQVDVFMENRIGGDNVDKLAELTRLLRDSLGGRVPGT
ncbi:MarR family winged helix-turn-helix transcriptional regulator [Granulosicoccus sp. 3-233]|uniref:MarR family winged helix-turn-helix transcriptional regulator n=1 Tax=Granulosicoccus sp. 3-233 TaxID=3417969 RepID=UPI003D32B2E3